MNNHQHKTADTNQDVASIIFVTGASRSGTTMISRILGNHTKVLGLNELHYFGDLCDPEKMHELMEKTKLERLASILFARQARGIWGKPPTELDLDVAKNLIGHLRPDECTPAGVFSAVLGRLTTEAGKNMACEQTPRNIFYARHLLNAYPNAYVVHMVRDPRAVLASQKNRWQMRRLGGRNVPLSEIVRSWFNYHPVTMCRLWLSATDAAIRLADHPRFMILRYEDVVSDPDLYVHKLCDFIGIDFEPDMCSIPQWGSSNISHSSSKKGISKEMLSKWEEVLSDGEIAISEYTTREFMGRFMYLPTRSIKYHLLSFVSVVLWYPIHVLGAVLTNPRRVWIQISAIFLSGRKKS